jgi:hypothetical protein
MTLGYPGHSNSLFRLAELPRSTPAAMKSTRARVEQEAVIDFPPMSYQPFHGT